MAAAERNDPYTAFNFLVEIDGMTVGGFSEVSGIESTVDVIEYRGGDEHTTIRKLPGVVRYPNLVLKRGWTDNRDLWEWYQTVIDGQLERRNGVITQLDESRQPVHRFEFREGWPCGWAGPHFDAGKSAVAIETLEICHEGIQLSE